MPVLTNFLLLCVALLVLLTLVMAWVLYPFDSGEKLQLLIAGILSATVLCAIVGGLAYVGLKAKNAAWDKPVSARLGLVISNTVVVAWFCVLALMLVVLLQKREMGTIGSLLVLFAIVALGCAWPIRRYFSRGSALPYGIGSLVALLAVLAVVAGLRL
jgi:hypothetical protein